MLLCRLRAEALVSAAKSRSGTPTTPAAKRKRPLVHLSLSTEAVARLAVIAEERGTSKSGAVEQLIRNARIAKD